MVYHMEKENVFMLMEVIMMEDGRTDSHMDLEKKQILINLFMMVIGLMERHKEKALSN